MRQNNVFGHKEITPKRKVNYAGENQGDKPDVVRTSLGGHQCAATP